MAIHFTAFNNGHFDSTFILLMLASHCAMLLGGPVSFNIPRTLGARDLHYSHFIGEKNEVSRD